MAKGGSKVVTAVIAFLLGFIFAILVEIGAIFGVYTFVTTADLDSIFAAIGIQNKDGDDYIYINTDSSNGGAGNLAELLAILKGYLYSDGSTMDFPVLGKSLDDINNLLPFVERTLAEKLYPVIGQYMDVDWEEFQSTSITELPQFLSNSIMGIRPAKLLEKLGMSGLVGDDANIIVKSLLAGAEFEYATTPEGLKFPVFYDTYVYDVPGGYYRTESGGGQTAFPHNISTDYLYDADILTGNGEKEYRLYFIPCTLSGSALSDAKFSDEEDYIYDESTTFLAVRFDVDNDVYVLDLSDMSAIDYPDYYGRNNIDRTGNYYYTNSGDELQIYPVTLGTFSDPEEVFKSLNCLRISQLLEGDIIAALFGSHTVGELIDGKLDIDSCVNNLTLAKVISIDPEESLMAYLGYGLTGVKSDGQGGYTGFVDVDGVSTECVVVVQNNEIKRVYYVGDNGAEVEVKGTKVSEVADLATGLEIAALMDVKADDAIMSYLGYGLSQVIEEAGDGYTHVGKCDVFQSGTTVEVDAYISTDSDGIVTSVWYYSSDGAKMNVRGTSINEISDRLSSLTDKLTLPAVLDIEADQSITMYIGYGITGAKKEAGELNGYAYSYTGKYTPEGADEPVTCYIATDENDVVKSAWYFVDGVKKAVRGTIVADVPKKIEGISNELTLADVMDISEDDTIMWALRDSKICDIGKNVKTLKLKDIISAEELNNSLILKQLKNKTVDELPKAVDAISIQSIYAKEIYKLENDNTPPHVADGYEKDVLYFTYSEEDDAYVYVHSDGEGELGYLTAEEFGSYEEGKLYTYGKAKGMWALILMVTEGEGGESYQREKIYTLNSFNTMIDSCAKNINNASLGTLQEAGIINGGLNLDKKLKLNGMDCGKLSDISLGRLIEILVSLPED